MALIIKADMPDCCGYDCDLWNEGICVPLEKAVDTHTRHHDCPIIGEIPDEHGRLIDADALMEQTENWYCSKENCGDNYNGIRCRACWVDDAIGIIDDAPTVLEANNE